MSTYFTVNIALHFLFNWKIEKSRLFEIRFSSNSDDNARGLGSLLSRTYFRKQRSHSSVAPDPSAGKQHTIKYKSEDRSSAATTKPQYARQGSAQSSSHHQTHPHPLAHQLSSAVLRGSNIVLIKELSDGSINDCPKFASPQPNTTSTGTLASLASKSSSGYMRSGSQEEKAADEVSKTHSPRSKIYVYADGRRLRKENSVASALRPLPEESQSGLM